MTTLAPVQRLKLLRDLERKVLWLSAWTVHHANHVRPNRDGLKVGGHQASCASLATVMTALYFSVLRPEDRIAVKPHASPVFHAIQYLFGNQERDKLENFRALGGAQSYPSRTKDIDDVDFSTGSVGLGVAMTLFSSIVQDYVRLKQLGDGKRPTGRMVALVGDAELDEGNIFEALLEGWKHDVRNLWWVIDYNRQSLDGVVNDRLFGRIGEMFELVGWRVVTLKYGKLLETAFAQPDGEHLRSWIDDCPNSLYSALVYKGGAGWREALTRDLNQYPGIRRILEQHDDASLHRLMTNLAGHDMQAVLDAFEGVEGDQPTCFIAYTIKGQGLPFAGHKDNHSGLMTVEQMAGFKQGMGIADGQEWEKFAGLSATPAELQGFLDSVPFNAAGRRRTTAPVVDVPALPRPRDAKSSTQEGFGKILNAIAAEDSELSRRIVTTSPDVTVSTNLGAWVNRRGLWAHTEAEDVFRELKVVSAQLWKKTPGGQHVELGIAENNLFLQLAAMGLSHQLFGARLLPIGTLYDPFIARGLDALNYGCYQDSRFMVVATPSGVTLAPEGGAHQSISTPLIGLGQPGLLSYEPTYVDELAVILRHGLQYMQADKGGSVYLRLSTRSLPQPQRTLSEEQEADIVNGGYWYAAPEPGADIAVVAMGAVTPEAIAAHESVSRDFAGAGLLVLTSPDRLHADWLAGQRNRGRTAGLVDRSPSPVERLLAPLSRDARIVTVLDGHPLTLSWLGSVRGHRVVPLGIETFGQSGDIPDLYRTYRLDAAAIVDAVARSI
ncbi:MAG: transketolase [Proteobacteria bacterium]|nr:transketolase [Pseudomonadota bacterium]